MKRQPQAYVVCTHCGGTGSIELTGVYAETLALVIRHPGKHGAVLAAIAKCKPCAMCNRLKRLEALGLVSSKRFGRKLFWSQKTT